MIPRVTEGQRLFLLMSPEHGGFRLAVYQERNPQEGPLVFPSLYEVLRYRDEYLNPSYEWTPTTAEQLLSFLRGRRRWNWVWCKREDGYEAIQVLDEDR